ncbi:alpha/beta-Hydrolases superfamily protein [Klebsormidium nitens]|uniref:Alpha/beta-Hydrolases superfamily protein n=1 Tax=Klebsormidium nitens TaxID=105231 RepID=A0A1Y1IPP3_KLENI|nr:alpha/beta-Hydrolases superfamily protein [Klebsormidium nitens]|eukprot:GAQ92885.1 alpha/beta-Hydrolases superfamily protein [Klebsormidium nitens]
MASEQTPLVAPGTRAFVREVEDFGTVQRTNLLGLSNTPVVVLDDGSARAYAGQRRAQVVNPELKKDVLGNSFEDIPLDVFSVGEQQLTVFGVPAEKQRVIFAKWRGLPADQKQAFIAQWEEVDEDNQAELNAFLQQMVVSYNLTYVGTVSDAFDLNDAGLSAAFQRFEKRHMKRPLLGCFRSARSRGSRAFDFKRYRTIDAYASDLLDIADALGIKTCAFVGHSVSGMIGLLASVTRPHLFERIVLLASSPRYLNDPKEGYVGGFSENDLRGLFSSMERGYTDWAKGFAPVAIGEPNQPAIRKFTEGLLHIRPDVALATCSMIFRIDLRHILPEVHPPCMILQSQNDVAVPLEVAQFMARAIRNSELEVLPTSGHLPHLSASLIVNSFIVKALTCNQTFVLEKGHQGSNRNNKRALSISEAVRYFLPKAPLIAEIILRQNRQGEEESDFPLLLIPGYLMDDDTIEHIVNQKPRLHNNIRLMPSGGPLRRISNNSRPRNSAPYRGAGVNYNKAKNNFNRVRSDY